MKIKYLIIALIFFIILYPKEIFSQNYIMFPCNEYYYSYFQNSGYYLIFNKYNEPIYIAILNPIQYQDFYNNYYNNIYPLYFEANNFFLLNPYQIFLSNASEESYLIFWPQDCNYNNGTIKLFFEGNRIPIGISTLQNIKTNSVRGYFYIYNLSSQPISLQLNAILEIDTINGKQYYWLQDVLEINGSYYYIADNIWNDTYQYISYLNPEGIIGNGKVFWANEIGSGRPGYYYAYSTQYYNIFYPLEGYLEIKVIDNQPKIEFIYNINGNYEIYDIVTINVQDVLNAYIVSSINYNNISHTWYDTEFVFGGPGNGESSYVNEMNAYLFLEYYDQSLNQYIPYNQYLYNFGLDTAETVSNLNSIIINNESMALVTNGNLVPMNFQTLNYIFANVTIYYPNGTYNQIFISNKPIDIPIPNEIYNGSIEYKYNGYFYINNQMYFSNIIQINQSGNYIIKPLYSELYLVNISSPVPINVSDFSYYYNVKEISGYFYSDSYLYIYLPKYYYLNNFERYYCNATEVYFYIDSPENIDLSNYFILQYLVNISSPIPVKINGNLTKNFEEYVNKGSEIYINKTEVFMNGIFYYIPSENIEVDKPILLSLSLEIDYTKTITFYIILFGIIGILIYLYRLVSNR